MHLRNKHFGFTLIELMISIAMVVVLMLGITKVFSLTSQTAGATNQVSAQLRDSRAVRSALAADFANAVGDSAPCMILHSTALPAFRNKADRDGDRDFDPNETNDLTRWNQILTTDLDGNNAEDPTNEKYPATLFNNRNHRLDTFSFFTRLRQKRQTGGRGDGTGPGPGANYLVDNMTSNEAWVWYGHLWLPDNNGDWPPPTSATEPSVTFPGRGTSSTNPNNFYATQWILGRIAMLLVRPNPVTPSHNILDLGSGFSQRWFRRDAAIPLSPLSAGAYDASDSTTPASTANITARFEDGRYDLAGTSIDAYRQMLYQYIPTLPPNTDWWSQMMCGESLPASYTSTNFTGGRFKANPFVPSSIDPETLSKQASILLPGCTQFIVEYAGDFLKQDTNILIPGTTTPNPYYGQIINAYWQIDPPTPPPPAQPTYPGTAPETDGQIDFRVTWTDNNPANGKIDATEVATTKREILWYGMPRDTNGDGIASGWTPGTRIFDPAMADVMPVRDVIRAGSTSDVAASTGLKTLMGSVLAATFERTVPPPLAAGTNYSGTVLPGATYNCAWSPTEPKPKMIRITMTIDDPSGKLAEGQTFEFVFSVP